MLKHPKKDAFGNDINYGDIVVTVDATGNGSGEFGIGMVTGSTPHKIKVGRMTWSKKFVVTGRDSSKLLVVKRENFASAKGQETIDILMAGWRSEGYDQMTGE